MEDFKKRLYKFVESTGTHSIRGFEERCGLANGTIASVGAKGPGANVVQKISYNYPNLNLNWLFTGNGEMINSSNRGVSGQKPLPLVPFDAIAGPGSFVYSDDVAEDYCFISEFRNSDFLIRIKGDSMTPRFKSGDVVACKIIKDNLFFQWGRVYVIYTLSQGVMMKRVRPGEKEGYITLVSDNTNYPPFQVPVSDIASIALVNGAIILE